MAGKSCTLTPAYGRDYKKKDEVLSAFASNGDFILNDVMSPWDGKPVNREQLISAGYGVVTFRYKKLRMSFVHQL